MSGCYGKASWQGVSLVVFIQEGLDNDKHKVCESTPQGGEPRNNQKPQWLLGTPQP